MLEFSSNKGVFASDSTIVRMRYGKTYDFTDQEFLHGARKPVTMIISLGVESSEADKTAMNVI